MFDLFDVMIFGDSREDSEAVDTLLDDMWEELDMLDDTGDLDAMDRVFEKYHFNFMALCGKDETHVAWKVS